MSRHAPAPAVPCRATARRAARLAVLGLATVLFSGPLAALPTATAASSVGSVENSAANPAAVSLAAATTYSVLGASTVTNTGQTVVGGDLGVFPGTAVTGFPPGVINSNSGAFHSADASAANAQQGAQAAFSDAQGRTPTAQYTPAYDIGSSTFGPGVYAFPSSIGVTGTVTLDGGGNPRSVFIFQAGSTLVTASASHVVLTNGAQAANVFWQVGSSATLGTSSFFAGTIVAQASVTVTTGVSVEGRTLALAGAVTLDSDTFDTAAAVTTAPTIAITSAATTNSSSPKITGTSNAPSNTLITVAIGNTNLIAHVGQLGYWTVTPSGLSDGSTAVHAEVSDSVGNVGVADQSLLVDTIPPALSISEQSPSNSATPTIAGTTDAAIGSSVRVQLSGQTLSGTVAANYTWAVTPMPLADGVHSIIATATDEAGNTTTVTGSVLTDTTKPVLTITSSTESRTAAPTLAGTTDAPVDSVITVAVDGVNRTAAVTASNTWSLTWSALAEGNHTLAIATTDEAGNVGLASQTFEVDTIAPKVFIASGAISNSSTPSIFGTSDNSVVTVTVGGKTYTVPTASDGTWSVTPPHLADAQYLVIATAVDRAGNLGGAQLSLTIDTIAPSVSISSPPLTRSSAPIITGAADGVTGTTVSVTIDAKKFSASLSDAGTWSLTAPALSDGSHSIAVDVADQAGNVGHAVQTLTIDTVAPVIAITSPELTNRVSPTVTGTTDSPAGTAVTVNISGHDYPATVQSDRTWSVVAATLTDGTYPVTATIYDLAGNRAVASQSLVIDSTAPVVNITSSALAHVTTPTVFGTSDAAGGTAVTVVIDSTTFTTITDADGTWKVSSETLSDGTHPIEVTITDAAGNTTTATQSLLTDTVAPLVAITSPDHTNDSTPGISGTTDAPTGATLTVTIDNLTLLTHATAAHTWSVAPGTLADGSYAVHASLVDEAGNVGQVDQVLIVDTVAPKFTITSSALTNNTTPSISGTTDADPGLAIVVTVDGQTLSTTASASGEWSVAVAHLAEGSYRVRVAATDLAGNVGAATQKLQIDTTAPSIAITSSPASTVSSPDISGTANGVMGTIVSVSVDGDSQLTTVDDAGRWTLSVGSLTEGPHSITATVTDLAGNVGRIEQRLVVDTVVPPTLPITATEITITSGALTRDATPLISGTANAADRTPVKVTLNGRNFTTTVNAAGFWSVETARVDDGEYTVTVTMTVPGATASDHQQLTVDTVAPTAIITSADITNNPLPTITGTSDADAGTLVTVQVDGQVIATSVSQSSTWAVTSLALADGQHAVTVTISDPAGNTVQSRETLVVDTIAPTVAITSSAKTNEATPNITGVTDAAPDSVVVIAIDNDVYNVRVAALNTWSFTSPRLSDGHHTVSASLTDLAGNRGVTRQVLVIDTTPPGIAVTSPALTDEAAPLVEGRSDAAQGSVITITVNRTQYSAVVSSTGTWAVETGAVVDGSYPVTATVADAAGNVGEADQLLTVDTTAPIIAITSLATSSTTSPTISGTTDALPFSPVTVTVDGVISTALVTWGGTWLVTSGVLASGSHSVVASTTDPAGNTGRAAQSLLVQLPTLVVPPVVPPFLPPVVVPPVLPPVVVPPFSALPVIAITSPALTNQSAPRITGTTSATPGAIVSVLFDRTLLTGVVGSDFSWSVAAPSSADGDHGITATFADAAGRVATAEQTLLIDTTAPVIRIVSDALTNKRSPVVSGTTDAGAGAVVTVTVDGTSSVTIAGVNGIWTVTPANLADGTHQIGALVSDRAGNTGSATQALVVTTVAPVIAFTSSAMSGSATPDVTGTSTTPAGSVIALVVGTQELAAVVGADGRWSAVVLPVSDADYLVKALTTDLAGNVGHASETLSVNTVLPQVTVGRAVTVDGTTPTLRGTSNAPFGSTVTIVVNGQTMLTTVGAPAASASVGAVISIAATGRYSRLSGSSTAATGSWAVHPTTAALGIYMVEASVRNAYGNVGHTTGTMTISIVPLKTLAYDPPTADPAALTPGEVVLAFTGGTVAVGGWGVLFVILGALLFIFAERFTVRGRSVGRRPTGQSSGRRSARRRAH